MDINRNQWFMIGLVFLFLGIQLRIIDSYVLNEGATQILAKNEAAQQPTFFRQASYLSSQAATPRKVVRPPEWLGWFLCSVGAVLIMHSLAMRRPD